MFIYSFIILLSHVIPFLLIIKLYFSSKFNFPNILNSLKIFFNIFISILFLLYLLNNIFILFLFILAMPMKEKMERLKIKYGLFR